MQWDDLCHQTQGTSNSIHEGKFTLPRNCLVLSGPGLRASSWPQSPPGAPSPATALPVSHCDTLSSGPGLCHMSVESSLLACQICPSWTLKSCLPWSVLWENIAFNAARCLSLDQVLSHSEVCCLVSLCGLSVQGFNSVASAHEDLFTENGTRAVCTRTEFRAVQLHQLPMEDGAQVAYPNLLPYFYDEYKEEMTVWTVWPL